MAQIPSSRMTPTADASAPVPAGPMLPAKPTAGRSPLAAVARGIWGFVTMNRKVMVGSGIIGFFVLVALFGPLFLRQDANRYTLNLLAPPSAAHWLGTNQGGQDVFSQMVVGTRASLGWSLVTGLLVVSIAVTVGLVSGYAGGALDDLLTVITNVFIVIPSFPLAIIAVQFFSRTTLTIVLVVALTNWPWGARVLRAQTLSMRNREYVAAARAGGERIWRIIFAEIFPNQISIVAASFITTTIQVLLAVAGLEFLGFGESGIISWGTMLYDAYNGGALLEGAWWWFIPPGLCIALLGSGLALLNFGIDELADPRLRGVRRASGRLLRLLGVGRRKAVAA